jgi:iron complex outermembrane recepter protein
MKNIARGLLPITAATLTFPAFAAQGDLDAGAEGADRQRMRGTLEEVIVTALKREGRLLDAPVSVSVLSGDELDRSSARGVSDVLSQVGGVAVTEIQPGQTSVMVRGVVSGTGSTTTAYYQDEIPFAYVRLGELPDSNPFDLARVEVLRGPQGTLYGANSMSGVVRILTNDADVNAFEAKGRARVSSTEGGGNNYGGDFAINVPVIAGQLAIRAVAGYSELSGYIESSDIFDAAPRPAEDINGTEVQNYRVKTTWQPTDEFSLKLGYSKSKIENDAPSLSLESLISPFSADLPDERELNISSVTAEYKWPSVSLLSSTGYIDYAPLSRRELLLAGSTPAAYWNRDDLRSFTQELRLTSHLDGPWQWSAGAFYSDVKQRQRQDVRPFFAGIFKQNALSESYAAFAEVTRSFGADRFELTAGVRYFNDRQTIQDLGDLFLTSVLVADQTAEFDNTTGRLVLTYKPDDDFMFYGSVASGFRSGAIQSPSVVRQAPSFPPIDPDSLITYEVGTKGTLLGGALSYDTAIYYTDWSDIQQTLILPIGFQARVNAGDASGIGVDANVTWQVASAFSIWSSVGWNDLKFDQDIFQFVNAIRQNVLLFAKDERLNNSPEWAASAGASYRMDLPQPGLGFVFSTSYAYGSERALRFLTGTLLRETRSDEMQQLRVSLEFQTQRWAIGLYGDNMLNDDGAVTPPDAALANTAVRQRPRTIGLQATFNY